MSFHQEDEIEYMADEGEMADVVDEMDGEFYGRGSSEPDDEYDILTRVTDTSSAQARRGKDIQGIPWDRLNITRETYRQTRLEQYKNYENVPLSGEVIDKECMQKEKGGSYYEFRHNTRTVKPTILHFQKHPGSLLEGFIQTQISTLAVKDNLLVAGGFQGELICKRLDQRGVNFCARTTFDDNAITNAIEIYDSSSGSIHFMTSNNDCGVREFNVERFQLLNHFRFQWPVNHTSVSPDGKLLAVVGDNLDGLLVDSQNGKMVASLVGHLDYSFASAWHPDGRTFATGNQDKTCRVWDVRNLSSPVAILKGNMGAVRSIHYSSDGRFLTVAEPADFVHIYDAKVDYKKRQEIDFFGEISGVSLSPDDESIFIGVWDRTYASLLQYSRRHAYGYLDSYV
ncbi:uncharacterized WD repeat-containing protein C2A9.03-like isoform X2 [Magnolia sinica]|uniref:uncharacterized WD repeat-containing protein C2A9.03-like isoform X2 n=1 Tax=Magnolia sinica TaxID=86752 RepID=UPI0026594A3C|nr:uncharacterized WD repeat-containing protein C2A9.03-like isoform X2 [Magnolia sinica]